MGRALFTDLYELRMAASFRRRGMDAPATFSLFVRALPPERGFLVACGLESCLEFLEGLSVDDEGFEELMEEQRARARMGTATAHGSEDHHGTVLSFASAAPPSRFVGYEKLRSETSLLAAERDDGRALVAAVASGLVDVIMSDHNPQDVEGKRLPFAEAASGAVGLE